MRRNDDLMDPANWPRDDETDVTPGWRFVSIGFEGEAVDLGGGVNPWNAKWRSRREWIVVAHPQYPRQRHTMSVYEIEGADPAVTFAAGEYSNGVWGFFVPHDPDGRMR